MFQSIIHFFFPSSVSGVMSSFQKVVNDLNKVADKQETAALKKDAKIDKLYDKVFELEDSCGCNRSEAHSARALASRVANQFGLTN